MWHFKFSEHRSNILWFLRGRRTLTIAIILCIIIAAGMLTACGSASTGHLQHSTKTPTPTLVLPPTATLAPVPTPLPTPPPTEAPMPAQPSSAPAILDLQPASMSILGHRDCQKNTAFVCFARVLSRANNQSNLNWSAYTDVPGNIVFNPSSGSVPPRSEEHTSELQSHFNLVCRLLLEKKKQNHNDRSDDPGVRRTIEAVVRENTILVLEVAGSSSCILQGP